MPQHERNQKYKYAKLKGKYFETCLEIQYFSTDNEHGGILFSIYKIVNYSINLTINLNILNFICQSIKPRFKIT